MNLSLKNFFKSVFILEILLAVSCSVEAQGVNQSIGFDSHDSLTANGSAFFGDGTSNYGHQVAMITDDNGNEAGSFFTNYKVNIAQFQTDFTFRISSSGEPFADGITFTIQNDSPNALGGLGGGLGYGDDYVSGNGGHIPSSVAIKFDTYNNDGEGINSSGLYTNGQFPSYPCFDMTGTGIDLHSQDIFHVTITYYKPTLTVRIVDLTTSASVNRYYTIDIPATIGNSSAYIGFTGATATYTSAQEIINWTYNSSQTSSAVLLVHGTWSDALTWNTLSSSLAGAYTVEAVNFPTEPETLSNETYIELQAKALSRRINELMTRSGQSSVNLVCHSMGGLAARYYLEHPSLWQNSGTYAGVSKLIMLGTPNWGLDSFVLDPVASIANAHNETQPLASDGYDTSAVDTYDNWSPALKEMFAEWEPAPNDADSLVNPYPANLVLNAWAQDNQGNYTSPIQHASIAYGIYVEGLKFGHQYGSDYSAVQGVLNAFPYNSALPSIHSKYYAQTAHQLGILYPSSSGVWGVQTRRVSPFLADLNTRIDTSNAKIYMVAGTYPVATSISSAVVPGPYVSSLPNDGIVPTDSAFGYDPIAKSYTVYPQATRAIVPTYHTDLPNDSTAIALVKQWLSASDWRAINTSAGSDGYTHLLWDKTDGTATVWTLDATYKVLGNPLTFGPFPGWTAKAIATGSDNRTRILWTNSDGRMTTWISDGNSFSGMAVFSAPAGWTATAIAVGNDGNMRILWTNSDGRMTTWTGNGNSFTYNPIFSAPAGWRATGIAVGGDGNMRILWANDDGRMTTWIGNGNGFTGLPVFGPFAGWTVTSIASGSDNKIRILWTNADGRMTTWLGDGNNFAGFSVFGPYAGFGAAGLATGGDGNMRVLWDKNDGTATVWSGNGNSFSGSPYFGPF